MGAGLAQGLKGATALAVPVHVVHRNGLGGAYPQRQPIRAREVGSSGRGGCALPGYQAFFSPCEIASFSDTKCDEITRL
jgi:hypothetical protein